MANSGRGSAHTMPDMGSHLCQGMERPQTQATPPWAAGRAPRERRGCPPTRGITQPGVEGVVSVIRMIWFKSWVHPLRKWVALGKFLKLLCASASSSVGRVWG